MATTGLTDEELRYLIPYSFRRRGAPPGRRISAAPRAPGARIEHGISVADGERLLLVMESVHSDWNQGVHLETDLSVIVDKTPHRRGVVLFHQPEKPEWNIEVRTRENLLWIWNVWDFRRAEVTEGPGSVISHTNFAGMLVEELPNGYRYRCNEGRDDDDYDDLIFRIERTGVVEPPRRRTRTGSDATR